MNIFKKILYFSIVFLFSKFSYADDGIDAAIDKWLTPISDFVVGKVFYSISIAGADVKLIVLWLIAGSIFCTFYFNFINLKMFRHALDMISLNPKVKYLIFKHYLQLYLEQWD